MAVSDELSVFDSIQTMEVSTGNPATVNDATAKNPLGALYHTQGKTYRYVKFSSGAGSVASAANGVAHWLTLTPTSSIYTVTSDQTDAGGTSIASLNHVAGIFGTAVTNGYYCFIQVGGVARVNNVQSGNTNSVGTLFVGHTVDLKLTKITTAATAVQKIVFGTALTTRSSSTTTGSTLMLLRNLDW